MIDFDEVLLYPPTLGAALQWQACFEFYHAMSVGMDLHRIMLILPMAWHPPTVLAIAGMQYRSGLLKALAEEPGIISGLQRRLEDFAPHSLTSLNLTCSAGLLSRAEGGPVPSFMPSVERVPGRVGEASQDVRRLFAASRRLGRWFGEFDLQVLSGLLGVRF